jgi:ubiquinone/menaquinone biosynthesis C-methylase UbiE
MTFMVESTLRPGAVADAFDTVAETYDEVFTQSYIGLAQRAAVHRELDRVFRAGQRILEINCGTGVDAVYLTRRGVRVLACDASARMIDIARRRTVHTALEPNSQFLVLPTERIDRLVETEGEAAFEGALSNFAGLNCVEDISSVARNLARLLKPGAMALICMFGRVCAWEVLWYLGHGKPKKAFRRLRLGGATAQLAGGIPVRVYYPSVGAVDRLFSPHFKLRRWTGVGVAVPPTYLEPVSCRFPQVLRVLAEADRWIGACPVLRGLADHALIKFERITA